jgi:hypothetical protein
MKNNSVVFVRERFTLRFLDENGAAIVPFSRAQTFASIAAAVDFCFKKSVRDAEIVMRMDDSPYDVVLEVA